MLELALKNANLLREEYNDISVYQETVAHILIREPDMHAALNEFVMRHAKPEIDAIAVTYGPGLEPALWMGVNFARALATVWELPLVPVNHMEGHTVVAMMESGRLAEFEFPALALLISGGHTELVLAEGFPGRAGGSYELISATRDDAVGEAFDKVARLMGLPYPGGPEVSRLASEARKRGLSSDTKLPRPMLEDGLDFSFAGLKTAVRRIVEAEALLSDDARLALAREFEDAVTEVLVTKTLRAIEEYGARAVVVGGGVSANEHIRSALAKALQDGGYGAKLLAPPPELSTDNAIMIGLAGYFRALRKELADPEKLAACGNLQLH
jgi:N6-L-threonylcarbamoyladenine synthase